MSPPDILLRIVERRRQRIAEAGGADPSDWVEGTPRTPSNNAFLGHLRARRRDPAIIAEVKMGSPRLGSLHGKVDPLAQARLYGENGAAASFVFQWQRHKTGSQVDFEQVLPQGVTGTVSILATKPAWVTAGSAAG